MFNEAAGLTASGGLCPNSSQQVCLPWCSSVPPSSVAYPRTRHKQFRFLNLAMDSFSASVSQALCPYVSLSVSLCLSLTQIEFNNGLIFLHLAAFVQTSPVSSSRSRKNSDPFLTIRKSDWWHITWLLTMTWLGENEFHFLCLAMGQMWVGERKKAREGQRGL